MEAAAHERSEGDELDEDADKEEAGNNREGKEAMDEDEEWTDREQDEEEEVESKDGDEDDVEEEEEDAVLVTQNWSLNEDRYTLNGDDNKDEAEYASTNESNGTAIRTGEGGPSRFDIYRADGVSDRERQTIERAMHDRAFRGVGLTLHNPSLTQSLSTHTLSSSFSSSSSSSSFSTCPPSDVLSGPPPYYDGQRSTSSSQSLSSHVIYKSWFPEVLSPLSSPTPHTLSCYSTSSVSASASASTSEDSELSAAYVQEAINCLEDLEDLGVQYKRPAKGVARLEYNAPVLRRTRHMLLRAYYIDAAWCKRAILKPPSMCVSVIRDFLGRVPTDRSTCSHQDFYVSVCHGARRTITTVTTPTTTDDVVHSGRHKSDAWMLCVTKRFGNAITYYGIYNLGSVVTPLAPVFGYVHACVGIHWAADIKDAPTLVCLLDAPDHYALVSAPTQRIPPSIERKVNKTTRNGVDSDDGRTIAYIPFDAPRRVRECLETLVMPIPAPMIDIVLLFVDRLDALVFALGESARQLAYCQTCPVGTGAVYVELLRRCVDCRHAFCTRHYEGEKKRCNECHELVIEQRYREDVCAECGKGARDCLVCGVCKLCHSHDGADPCERTCAGCTCSDAPIRDCCHCCPTCCDCDPYEHVEEEEEEDQKSTSLSSDDVAPVVDSETKNVADLGGGDDVTDEEAEGEDTENTFVLPTSLVARGASGVDVANNEHAIGGKAARLRESEGANDADDDDGERIDMDAGND
jgi:hypothetical protein